MQFWKNLATSMALGLGATFALLYILGALDVEAILAVCQSMAISLAVTLALSYAA